MQLISKPLLYGSSPLLKLLSLLLLILLSLLFTMVFGMALGFLFFGSDMLVIIKGGFVMSAPGSLAILKFLQTINTLGLFVFPPLIFASLVSEKPWQYLAMMRTPRLVDIFLGLSLIIVVLPFLHWLAGINEMMEFPVWFSGIEDWMKQSEEQARQITELFLSTKTYSGLAVNLIMIAVLPAIGEEFLFRGILQRLFQEWWKNVHLAVFIATLLFSALHLQFFGFLPRLVLGLFLGYLFVWTRSIWVPVIVHFFNNGIAVVAAWFYARGSIQTSSDSLGDMPETWIIILSFVITVLIIWMFWKGRDKKMGSTNE
ncbi:MAG: type II CAAX endopeptidase family protein [Bacteroidales bacterium]|nr:type II CAAX endopeptidase family protein [Bacteroidales bacterium]